MSTVTQQLGEVTIADVDATPRPTARLGRYAIWQARDYLRGAGGATLVLSGLAIVVLTSFNLQHAAPPQARAVTSALIGALGFLAPIFACSGLVADDRSKGYYRFLLAHPVSPVRYYGQAFLLRGAALLGVTAVVWLACALLLAAGSFAGALAYVALCYLTVGGVTLLLSTMTRHAWLATLILGAASGIATGLTRGVWRPFWMAIHAVLPPFHLTGALASVLLEGNTMPHLLASVAWFAGYGLLAVGAALAVIRRREWPL
jgi:ABC-type transport system involved in multi-copper enzyme maturation permease subunit